MSVRGVIILSLVIGVVALLAFYTQEKNGRLLAEKEVELALLQIQEWKDKFNIVLQAQQEGEETIKQLMDKSKQTEKEMEQWQEKNNETSKKLATVTKKIRKLEKENAEVRSLLSMPVPCELWIQIFPNSTKCNSPSDKSGTVYRADVSDETCTTP